jgi:transcriptional pleiotropic regulator of transition state genes
LELSPGDGVEIFVEKDRVILKKYEPSCIFCGDADDVVTYKEKKICRKCLDELKAENEA